MDLYGKNRAGSVHALITSYAPAMGRGQIYKLASVAKHIDHQKYK